MEKELQFPLLLNLGLSLNEAKIYELLLKRGPSKPPELVKDSGILRANVYHILDTLVANGLALKIEGKSIIYEAIDPSRLRTLLEAKTREAKRLTQEFETVLPFLTSSFLLSTGKPAIEIFEGVEGVATVLNESLETDGEILTILDPDAMTQEFLDVESKYLKKRLMKQIKKRIILPNVEKSKSALDNVNQYTEKMISCDLAGGFKSAMEIYDDTVTLITLGGDRMISVSIKNKSLAMMQKSMFEGLWKKNG